MAGEIHTLFRELVVPGEILVAVKGGAHMSGYAVGDLTELGLAEREIKIVPYYQHVDVTPTGFGGVACDVVWRLAHVDITLGLIHYDQGVLEILLDESAANGGIRWGDPLTLNEPLGRAGIMAPTGRLLGGRKAMYESGNHFFSVNLLLASGETDPYRFRMCHLSMRPATIPMGTDTQVVDVTFRALPYQDPYRSGVFSGTQSITTVNGQGDAFAVILAAALGALPGPPGTVLRSGGVRFSKRREILGSGAVLYDRTPDVSGVIGVTSS